MASKKTKTNAPTSGIKEAVSSLVAQGFQVLEHTYAHGYTDILWTDMQGVKHLREFRPDGSEIFRDPFGQEVS